MEEQIKALVAYLQTHQEYILPIIFLMGFGECFAFLSLLVPATVFFTLFGAAAGAAGLSLVPIAVAGGLGAGLGFSCSYWLGLWIGPRAEHHWPFRDRPDLLQRGHAFFEKYGAASIFLGHFFGPVRAVIALVAGIATMPALPFHIANWTASMLWGFLLLYGTGAAGERLSTWLGWG